MELIQDNLVASMFIFGLAILVVEVLILGFSTLALFFLGLASIATGILFFIGVLPESLLNAFLSSAILTAIFAGVLWQPLKNIQQKTDHHKAEGDLIGVEFDLPEDLTPGQPFAYRYSGIEWQLKSSGVISAGSKVKVTEVEVGIMHVAKVV